MVEIRFDSKENLRLEREQAFLALSPSKRFQLFLQMCDEFSKFSRPSQKNKGNFIVKQNEISTDG